MVHSPHMRLIRILVLASVATAILGEAEANACSCMQLLFGGGKLYVGADGKVPVDAKGFAWSGPEPLAGSKDRVKVVRVEGNKKIAVKHTIAAAGALELIVPAGKLKAGQVYEVTVRESAAAAEQRKSLPAEQTDVPPPETVTSVTIVAEPLKLTQATVVAGAPEEKDLTVRASASCSTEVRAATVPVKVELPPEVEPLRDYLVFETRVDGQPWVPTKGLCQSKTPGRSWSDATGTDIVYAVCGQGSEPSGGSIDNLPPGKHKIEVEVATADRAQVLTTPAIEVEFTCAPTAEPPKEEPPPTETPQTEAPPPVAKQGCSIGDTGPAGSAWVLAMAWLVRRRRRPSACA